MLWQYVYVMNARIAEVSAWAEGMAWTSLLSCPPRHLTELHLRMAVELLTHRRNVPLEEVLSVLERESLIMLIENMNKHTQKLPWRMI